METSRNKERVTIYWGVQKAGKVGTSAEEAALEFPHSWSAR